MRGGIETGDRQETGLDAGGRAESGVTNKGEITDQGQRRGRQSVRRKEGGTNGRGEKIEDLEGVTETTKEEAWGIWEQG